MSHYHERQYSEFEKIEHAARQERVRSSWTESEERQRRAYQIIYYDLYSGAIWDYEYDPSVKWMPPVVHENCWRSGRQPLESDRRVVERHNQTRHQYCRDEKSYQILRSIEG